MHHGSASAYARMVCGFLGCNRAEGNPVLSTLPPLLDSTSDKAGPHNGSVRPSSMPSYRCPSRVRDRAGQTFRVVVRRGRAAPEALPPGQTGLLFFGPVSIRQWQKLPMLTGFFGEFPRDRNREFLIGNRESQFPDPLSIRERRCYSI